MKTLLFFFTVKNESERYKSSVQPNLLLIHRKSNNTKGCIFLKGTARVNSWLCPALAGDRSTAVREKVDTGATEKNNKVKR